MRGPPRVWWPRILREMHHALLVCEGVDRTEAVRWFLFALRGGAYFTIEVPVEGTGAPRIMPCTRQGAVALMDDAERRHAPTLDYDRALEDLWKRLFGLGNGPSRPAQENN